MTHSVGILRQLVDGALDNSQAFRALLALGWSAGKARAAITAALA